MQITLFDIVWRCMVTLGVGRSGTATGGSTTTVIDTNYLKKIDNRYFDDGTAFILKSTDGELPQSTFSVVTKSDQASGVLTLQDALTEVAAGDIYGVAPRRYPLYLMTQMINNALYLDGYIPRNDVTLTTVAAQKEYTMPVGMSRNLREIWVQTRDDSDMNDWIPVVNYNINYSDTGSQDTLVLAYELQAGRTLMLRYAEPHGVLRLATDKLNDVVHPDRIIYQASAEAMRWYKDKTRLVYLEGTITTLERKAQTAKDLHPLPPLPLRQAKIGRVTRTLKID